MQKIAIIGAGQAGIEIAEGLASGKHKSIFMKVESRFFSLPRP